MRERCKFFVGNLVEPVDVSAILLAELRQPHVGALGDQHGVRHPRRVRAELLVFVSRIAEDRHLGVAVDRRPLLLPRSLRRCAAAAALAAAAASAAAAIPRLGLNCIQMASSSSCRTSPAIIRKRSRLSPSSGFHILRIRSSCSLSELGRGDRGSPQKLEKTLWLGVVHFDQWTRGEICRQSLCDLRIAVFSAGLCLQKAPRTGGRLRCDWPSTAAAVLRGRLRDAVYRRSYLPAIAAESRSPVDRGSREMLHERQQQLVELFRSHALRKPAKRIGHHLGIKICPGSAPSARGWPRRSGPSRRARRRGRPGRDSCPPRAPGSSGGQTDGTPTDWRRPRCR